MHIAIGARTLPAMTNKKPATKRRVVPFCLRLTAAAAKDLRALATETGLSQAAAVARAVRVELEFQRELRKGDCNARG